MVNSDPTAIDLSIPALQKAYRQQQLTPDQLIEQLLARCEHYRDHNVWIELFSQEQLQPYLDQLATLDPDASPLWGIPFAIKDNIDLAGVPTTAACPAYAYTPENSAFVVELLIAAGGIPMGKTNLDQFATGLVGTRSPYGACKNSFDPAMTSGGSSSGSGVAVALGLVSFALGTDTAGSGRVPAAFNNVIGTKPTLGLLSRRGVVPACKALDTVTFFTLTQTDANTLLDICAVYDPGDSYSRRENFAKGLAGHSVRIGVPIAEQQQFFDHPEYPQLFQQASQQLAAIGAELVPVNIAPLLDAAKLLYQGPWVAERYHAVGEFIDTQPQYCDSTVAKIILGAQQYSAVDAFDAIYQLQDYKRQGDDLFAAIDCLLLPTTTQHYTIEDIAANPIELNSRYGYYTNFVNLLDYCALAIPAGFTTAGLPFGITLVGPAFTDRRLQTIAGCYLSEKNWGMGATGLAMPESLLTNNIEGYIPVAVCGAHLSGMPLNQQLLDRNARLLEVTTTSPDYQFYALSGGPPFRPGLKRVANDGASIYVEVWAVPAEHFGSFVAGIPAPLGIGKMQLADGRWVPGFICEPLGIEGAQEITALGDWRKFIKNKNKA